MGVEGLWGVVCLVWGVWSSVEGLRCKGLPSSHVAGEVSPEFRIRGSGVEGIGFRI